MFTTRVIDASEKERFNKFIALHPRGHFLQLWEWGQVKEGTGWSKLPLILENDGEIVGALLILKRKLPLPGLNKCIFYAPRGPVVDAESEELNRQLFLGAEKVAREHGAIFLKLDPDINNNNNNYKQILQSCGFKENKTGLNFEGVQPRFVFRLDITPSEIKLLENMHSKWRYNIRLAQRKDVRIRTAMDKNDLKVFYSILTETAQRDNFLIRDYKYFEWIWDYMVENGYARIFIAEHEDEVIASTLAMILGDKVWYLYGASSNRKRNLMPNYLIQWAMIRWAREQGCTLYDFRGVSGDLDESNPLYGLYRFKKGFGGELIEFIGEWDKIYSPFYYFLWNKILPLYKSVRRTAKKSAHEQGE
jgi:peptidoglycan pentaglycine glycine transferase (the first glycine)